jgi:hypothetical protein
MQQHDRCTAEGSAPMDREVRWGQHESQRRAAVAAP